MTTPPDGERRSDRTKTAILAATRTLLARQGYERTTIRAVAADAAIDPAMVMRYFGSKEGLVAAAMDVDLGLPDLAGTPRDDVPRLLVRHFVRRWEGDASDDGLLLLLRAAVTNEAAAQRMREVFAAQVAPAITAALPPGADVGARAGLVAAQLLGLAVARHVLRLPGVEGLDAGELEDLLTPAVRATLGL